MALVSTGEPDKISGIGFEVHFPFSVDGQQNVSSQKMGL